MKIDHFKINIKMDMFPKDKRLRVVNNLVKEEFPVSKFHQKNNPCKIIMFKKIITMNFLII